MRNSVGKKAKKSIGNLVQDSFEKIKEEPGELARSAGEQLSGTESSGENRENEATQIAEEQRKQELDRKKSERLMKAHKSELEEIRKANIFEEVQGKIQAGQQINLSTTEGLSEKQREVLRNQQELVQKRKQQQGEMAEKSRGLAEPSTKQKRGLFQRAKKKIDQMKTRIETRFKSMG